MKKTKIINVVKFCIFILIIGIGLTILFKNREFIMHLNVEEITKYAQSANTKLYAFIICLLIFVIKPFFIIIPSSIISIANGLIFGPIEGFVVSMIGNVITSSIAFYLARILGKGFVEGILGKRLSKFEKNFEEKQFKILLLIRLIPIIPLDPVSYACGLSKISYKKFMGATLLATIPETACYSVLGNNVDKPFSPAFIIPIAILIIGLLVSKKIMKKIK